jgi:hypothetical protein
MDILSYADLRISLRKVPERQRIACSLQQMERDKVPALWVGKPLQATIGIRLFGRKS